MARDKAYQEAEQRIEAARHEGSTELVLSRMGLTELPEAIASLTQLQELDLSSNQLTRLPEAIASLTQLKKLNLWGNQLTALPEAIASLTQLQTLDLSNNQLTELPEAIASLTQLQELDLSSNQLTALPEVIASLIQSQELRLFYNELTTIPEWIDCFTQLKHLSLSGNRLKELPKGIFQLRRLQSLDLGYNQLETISNSICNLTRLESFEVIGNKLQSLPDSLAELKKLEVLWLGEFADKGDGNPLGHVPECIRLLKRLELLGLSNCSLTSLPDWLEELHSLKTLQVYANQLIDLPTSLGCLVNLKNFYLDGNPLDYDLSAAYERGTEAIMQYLRARAEGEVALNEAKLILVGEGEVGKSCLLGALRGDDWVDDRPTTHGIEIKPVIVTAPNSQMKITLNGWDFGGQRVYRPTHQLFFSPSALYLVVWKPRKGSQQGFVKEWIMLIKHRELDAKVLVVATVTDIENLLVLKSRIMEVEIPSPLFARNREPLVVVQLFQPISKNIPIRQCIKREFGIRILAVKTAATGAKPTYVGSENPQSFGVRVGGLGSDSCEFIRQTFKPN